PRCNGQGNIRTVKSLALAIIRVMEEECLKERSAIVRAIVPIPVSAYLLNEKRGDLAAIERRTGTHLVIVPSPGLETPHFEVERLRDDHAASAADVPSYELAEVSAEVEAALVAETPTPPPKEAVVKAMAPTQPPPSPKATPTRERSGLFSRLLSAIKGSETAASEPRRKAPARGKSEPSRRRAPRAERPQEARRERGERGRTDGDRRRRGEGRPDAKESRQRGRGGNGEQRRSDRGRRDDQQQRGRGRRDDGRGGEDKSRREDKSQREDKSRREDKPRSEDKPRREERSRREERPQADERPERASRSRRRRNGSEQPERSAPEPAVAQERAPSEAAQAQSKRKPRRDRAELSADAPVARVSAEEGSRTSSLVVIEPTKLAKKPSRAHTTELASNDPRVLKRKAAVAQDKAVGTDETTRRNRDLEDVAPSAGPSESVSEALDEADAATSTASAADATSPSPDDVPTVQASFKVALQSANRPSESENVPAEDAASEEDEASGARRELESDETAPDPTEAERAANDPRAQRTRAAGEGSEE
ncbi:MAG: hypothetical protein P8Y95_06910, partial [Gammaproteobacteria bacterium]